MKKIFILIMVCTCLMLCACGDWDSAVCFEETSATVETLKEESDTSEKEVKTLCVYVCGAVETPGVYELPEGSRAIDALEAAGGFLPEACKYYVNLAKLLSDSEKLFFPTEEEAGDEPVNSLININTASAKELTSLPGVGESRAKDIINYREQQGGFRTVEDIMKVSGIKESLFNKIKDMITV